MDLKTVLDKGLLGIWAERRNGHGKVLSTAAVPAERKALIWDPRLFWNDATFATHPWSRDPDNDTLNRTTAYAVAALAYICIQYRAKKFAEAPLAVFEETDDGFEWLPKHPLTGLLSRPAPDMTMRRMLELSSIFRDTTGAVAWIKTRAGNTRIKQLRPFDKDRVKVEADGDRWWGKFHISNLRGPEVTLSWRDVVYFYNPHPENLIDGALAPLEVALNLLNLGESVRVQARNLIKKAVRPTGAFMTDENLSDDQFERARLQINQRVQGPQNAGDWLLLEGGARWQQISQTVSEILPENLIDWIEATVCTVFGLHASPIGLHVGMKNSPWSNLEQATENIYRETILPHMEADAEILTDQLLREVDDDPKHVIRFDTTGIRALKEDLETRIEKYRHAFPYLTVDEIRQLLEYQPLGGPQGEQRYIPTQWIPADMLVEQMTPLNGGPPDGEGEEEDSEESVEEEAARR